MSLQEGKYVIFVEAMKRDTDEKSAMAPYLGETAIVSKIEDELYITFMLTEQKIITGFQLSNDNDEFYEAIDTQVNEELDNRYEMFHIKELTDSIVARVQYEVTYEGRKIDGDEQLRLMFDLNSLKNVEELDL